MNYLIRFIACLLSLGFLSVCNTNEEKKLKIIILTGRNNHDWKATTNQLEAMYNATGHFELSVTTSPDTLNYKDFTKFDVVLSNWNQWPDKSVDWPKSTKEGLMKYVENGGGFVLFHAASASFYDWEDFHQLIGGTWGKATRHGKITKHKIVFNDKKHPITKGMQEFWITDELWGAFYRKKRFYVW